MPKKDFEYCISGPLEAIEQLGQDVTRVTIEIPASNDRISLHLPNMRPALDLAKIEPWQLIYEVVGVTSNVRGLFIPKVAHTFGSREFDFEPPPMSLSTWRDILVATRGASRRP